jgi:hypothetical protein
MKQSVPAGDFFFVPASEAQELEDLRTILRLPAARRVCRRLLSAGNVMGPSMGADGRCTEYNEGLRALGIWLATKIETAAPGELARLMQESGNDRLAANAKTNRSKNHG